MESAIRIILVDGRELVRHGLRHMLEPEEDMKVVGECASAEEALVEMVRLHQDIVLMGTKLPGINIIEATRSLKRNGRNRGVEVIIVADSVDYRVEALEAGAANYLLKDVARTELVQVIRRVYRDRHSSKECNGLVEESVELVIPSLAEASWMLRFMCQLGEILHEKADSIICTVGSWDCDTIITVHPESITPSNLLITLANMPEVEKVEEESLPKSILSSFSRKFGALSRLRINPTRRLRVTLRETDVVKQEFTTVLN